MTGRQRKAHFWIWLVLGPLALLGLVLAVVLRPPSPVEDGPLPGVEPSAHQEADASAPVEGGKP